MKSLIQKLVETTGPSGYESQIRAVIRAEVEAYADQVHVDALGNLIVTRGQLNPGGQKVMLAAHMDEIGLIATHVDENGFVRFTTIGGVQRKYCSGGRVCFFNGTPGVIGLEQLEDQNKMPTFEQMFIDVGAANRAECPVRVGDMATFDRPFADFGMRLVSKAMDDRIGVAVLVETLRQMGTSPNQVFFVFSVQEEVGLRGATTAAFGLDPDIGIAVDVTGSGDTPKGLKMSVALGKGPAIKVRDGGMLSDPRIVDWMVHTADKAQIPYQIEVLETGTTDARAIQLTRAGVPVGCVSIPCRYIHAPSEMVDYNDVQNAVRLLLALVSQPVHFN
ncbi:MAG: aminopeptidase [Chloroflexi bacterium RBG_19FT_COMBO_55_16]|nr:MAG: aminopeptidase [Chloroflexi bacterium RBG_19FT_COMBO_55_16]